MFLLVLLLAPLAIVSDAGELELRNTFADQYSVWVADLQPGYVVETQTINGQTCYCKVLDNSTSTSTSTTTTTPITTTVASPCGNCDKTIIISYDYYTKNTANTETWRSPNYPSNYPEGCTCTLTIKYEVRGTLSLSYAAGDKIKQAGGGCSNGDHVVYSGDIQQQTPLCGPLTGISHTFADTSGLNLEMAATFVSTSADGGTEKGFELSINMIVY
ncbi:uncharacterized protein LOC122265274 [Penaeus japonicus]|uniref:uncharacterized protein LOC122265274 n=1 Tax=Penaeus japonicus TaxID=27405 RepID=UPI001C71411A|nr:uncharacterized protein LOC122265274 [Penaeus japonicus]